MLLYLSILIVLGSFIYSFFSPELSIRRYIFTHGYPIQALTVKIEDREREDPEYGSLFRVYGYVERFTGMSPGFFYIKRNSMGLYYVETIGTGP